MAHVLPQCASGLAGDVSAELKASACSHSEGLHERLF